MALKFPDSADSADLAAAGYSQVIILGGGTDSASTSATADYLILAGGGGGGGIIAGGGGAGGYRTSWGTGADGSGGNSGGLSSLETALTLNNGTAYSITVGQGGEGGFGWNAAAANANPHQGRDTTISGSDITTITSDGGGGGSAYNHNTGAIKDGGSAGGGALGDNSSGTPTTGQGFSGGISGDTNAAGGGGGGAGQAGGNSNAGGSNTLAGTGGDGLASTITGTSVVRGGGGSGGARGSAGQYLGDYSTTPIPGGDGGGGVGGILNGRVPWVASGTNNASDGRAGYGGGGGGGGYTGTNASVINAGNGGSGIAIFRLPSTVTYSASQLASDLGSTSNCTASYLNTQVYTDDTNFGDVTLLLDGNGTNNQTSFTDLSLVQTPITTFGNAHVDTSVKKFGSGSIEFDGNGDYLRTSDFGLTSGDFTIEAWVQLKAMPTSDSWPAAFNSWMEIVGVGTFNAADGWQFRIGQTLLAFGTNADTTAVTGTHGMSTGTWYHLAVTRSGNVYTLYVDGSSVGSATYTTQQPGSGAYGWIGAETGQGAYLNGYIDDLRITKGVARSITTPTSALPSGETSTGGDHVITFTAATEDPYDGATTNDGTATWTPTLSTTTPAPSTTWTIPEGVDSFSIMAIGAGGAAGYSDSTSAGGGGGGGGLAYLNNIAVAQGDNVVQSITVGGGQLGLGADSNGTDGGDATDLTVTMNLSTADPALNLSGYNINPYGQDSHIDSFGTILFVGANRAYDSNLFDSEPTLNLNFDDSHSSYADQFVYVQPTGSFGAGYPFSVGTDGAQTLFDIANEGTFSYIKSLAEADPNTTNRWGYNPATFNYAADPDTFLFKRADTLPHLGTDSDLYIDSDVIVTYGLSLDDQPTTVLGTIDSSSLGTGAFTLFGISSNIQSIFIGQLPGQSPYVDSNGTIIISNTGDPTDYEGYGPQDLNQILIIKNLTP